MATLSYKKTDPQQFPLYDAEHDLRSHRQNIHYATFDEVKAFVQKVTESPEWKALKGPTNVSLRVTRHDSGIASCMASKTQLNLPGWAWQKQVVLHELAHLVVEEEEDHGPLFAGTALMLYRRFIGAEFSNLMEKAYINNEVKIRYRRFKYAQKGSKGVR